MANIDRIVNVAISLQTAGITQEGFSTILVAGPHALSLNRVDIFSSADGVLTAGFKSTDLLYKAVADAFSQTPAPKTVKVGRRQVDVVKLTPATVADNAEYSVTLSKKATDGTVSKTKFTYTSSTGATATTIAAGLQTLIAADSTQPVTATADAGVLTLTNKTPGTAFAVELSAYLSITQADPVAALGDDLTAINNEDSDWYGFAITSRVQADILATADWAEARKKIFGCCVAEPGAIDAAVTTDTMTKLKDGNYFRTYCFYHADAATDFLELAIMAKSFALEPGQETWANQRLSGVTTDKLNETQAQAALKKNGNTFEPFRNVVITQGGKVAGGEWIDIIRFRDWLEEEIKVRVFRRLLDNKVPYTDGGIAIIENEIRGALLLAQRRGGLAPTEYDEEGKEIPGFTVSVPLSANISANDKANRLLQDVTFKARPSGAIHLVEIAGTLTYDNI